MLTLFSLFDLFGSFGSFGLLPREPLIAALIGLVGVRAVPLALQGNSARGHFACQEDLKSPGGKSPPLKADEPARL